MYRVWDERYLKKNNTFASSGDFISGVSISGGLGFRGALNINAGSNITLTQVGSNSLTIASAGGGGGSATNGVTGITVSGSNVISGAINFSAGQNVLLGINGNNITINATGANSDNISILFGSKELNSGFNNETITFPNPFAIVPKVIASIYNNSGQDILGFQLSGLTTGGFSVNLSETIPGTGYNLNYFASTGDGLYTFGQTTITSVGSVISNGITGSGILNYIPKFTNSSGLINSNIVSSGVGVGIGTESPQYKLDVIDNGNNNAFNGIAGFTANNKTVGVGIGYQGIETIGTASNTSLYLNGNGTSNVIMQNRGTGAVLIGTTTNESAVRLVVSASPLHVRLKNPNIANNVRADIGLNTLSVLNLYSYDDTAGSYKTTQIDGSPIALNIADGTTNVGIKTSSPISALDVSGFIHCSGGRVLTVQDSGNLRINIESTGTSLQNRINSLSGYVDSSHPNILLFRQNGTYTGFYGNTDIAKGNALLNAANLLTTGYEKLIIGGGIFNLGEGTISLPQNTYIEGQGYSTIIKSNANGVLTGAILQLSGNNITIRNIKIYGTTGGVYQYPIGGKRDINSSGAQGFGMFGFQNVLIDNVWLEAETDGIYIYGKSGEVFNGRVQNSIIKSKWDAIASYNFDQDNIMSDVDMKFFNVDVHTSGGSSISPDDSHCFTIEQGNFRVFDSYLKSTNTGLFNATPIRIIDDSDSHLPSGDFYMYGGEIVRSGNGGSDFILPGTEGKVYITSDVIYTNNKLIDVSVQREFIDWNNKTLLGTWTVQTGRMSGINIPAIKNSGSILNLGNNSFYVHTGNVTASWILPSISSSNGRMYYLKNKGNSVILSGNSATEYLFTHQRVQTINMLSGNSLMLANDGQDWSVFNNAAGEDWGEI